MTERLDEIDTRKDKRAPRAIKESVRRSMRGNKSKDTLPELLLRKMLFTRGVRGYRNSPREIFKKSLLMVSALSC
jgi:hypothetical protein